MHWQCAKTAKELQTVDCRLCVLLLLLVCVLFVCLACNSACPLPPPVIPLPSAALSLLLPPLFAFAIDEIVAQHSENSLQLDTLAVRPVEGAERGSKGCGAV